MSTFLRGTKVRRLVAAALGMMIVGAVAAPDPAPARGDGPVSVSVGAFQNEAGASGPVATDLSDAAYRAVQQSGRFSARGGGPLNAPKTLTDDPFVDSMQAAARAGADEALLGSVIQVSGGQVYYRLSLYRVVPMAFVSSQIFSAPYPAGAATLTAALSSAMSTLWAPRQAMGTIYSTTNGVMGDVGSASGFMVGDRFSVRRNNVHVADATITSIRSDDAVLEISNATAGYKPELGDTLVGMRAMSPVAPPPPAGSGFSVLGLLAAAGGVLLAIGHHGQPGLPGGGVLPTPTSSPFTVSAQPVLVNLPQATFSFLFSDTVSTTAQTNIPAFVSFAQVNTQLPGAQATSPPQTLASFCNCTVQFQTVTGATGPQTLLSVAATNLVSGEQVFFNFFPSITDTFGNTLAQPAFFTTTLQSIYRHPLSGVAPPKAGPVAPGPGTKPGTTPAAPPDPRVPKNPHGR